MADLPLPPLFQQGNDYPARLWRYTFDTFEFNGIGLDSAGTRRPFSLAVVSVVSGVGLPKYRISMTSGTGSVRGITLPNQNTYVFASEADATIDVPVVIGATDEERRRPSRSLLVVRVYDTNAGDAEGDFARLDIVDGVDPDTGEVPVAVAGPFSTPGVAKNWTSSDLYTPLVPNGAALVGYLDRMWFGTGSLVESPDNLVIDRVFPNTDGKTEDVLETGDYAFYSLSDPYAQLRTPETRFFRFFATT